MKIKTRHGQRGVAAVEFAIIFVILFTIFYALVSYTFPLLILESLNHATAQAARAALQVDPTENISTYTANVTTVANNEITTQLGSWMPATIYNKLTPPANRVTVTLDSNNNYVITVTLSYADYKTDPVVPTLTFPVVGQVPDVPQNLTAQASISP